MSLLARLAELQEQHGYLAEAVLRDGAYPTTTSTQIYACQYATDGAAVGGRLWVQGSGPARVGIVYQRRNYADNQTEFHLLTLERNFNAAGRNGEWDGVQRLENADGSYDKIVGLVVASDHRMTAQLGNVQCRR